MDNRTRLCAAAYLAACGSNPPRSRPSPPGNPGTAGNQVASGPMLGARWDSDRKGLRVVYGVLGAAQQGPPTYGGTFSGAAVCMRKSIALLTTSSGAFYLACLPQGRPVAIASSGIAQGGNRLQPVVRNLPCICARERQGSFCARAALELESQSRDVAGGRLDCSRLRFSGDSRRYSRNRRFGRHQGGCPGVAPRPSRLRFSSGSAVWLSCPAGIRRCSPMQARIQCWKQPISPATSAWCRSQAKAMGCQSGSGRGVRRRSRIAVADGKASSALRLDLTGQTAPQHTVCDSSPRGSSRSRGTSLSASTSRARERSGLSTATGRRRESSSFSPNSPP
jgi:hypothetical protein